MKKIFNSAGSPLFPAVLFLITIFAFFISCADDSKHIPSNIIPKDKMADVLVDVQLAEASSDNRGLAMPQINSLMAARYDSLFRKHQINFTQFKSSYEFYLDHPEYLSDIYSEVVNKLTTLESKVSRSKKLNGSPVLKKDSLQQVLNHRLNK